MRIKLSVTRLFLGLVIPAISLSVATYFGSHAIWSETGLFTLEETQARLSMQQQQLDQVLGQRTWLERRIALMAEGHPDPDLVEELARVDLMDGGPGQVAIPRTAH